MRYWRSALLALLTATGCASAPQGEPGTFRRLATDAVMGMRGGDYVHRIIEMNTSPDERVACGTMNTRRFANVFAVVLDRPYPNHTTVEVKALPDFGPNPTPETRERVGREVLQMLGEIERTCRDAGAALPNHL